MNALKKKGRKYMEFSRPHVLREATLEYLETLDPQNPPNPETIAETILTVTTEKCREVNATRSDCLLNSPLSK